MIATVKCLLHGVACAVLAAPLMQLEASFDQLAAKCSSSGKLTDFATPYTHHSHCSSPASGGLKE